jgi:hypothetical protein
VEGNGKIRLNEKTLWLDPIPPDLRASPIAALQERDPVGFLILSDNLHSLTSPLLAFSAGKCFDLPVTAAYY